MSLTKTFERCTEARRPLWITVTSGCRLMVPEAQFLNLNYRPTAQALGDVRFVPKKSGHSALRKRTPLFDHLVGNRERPWRHIDAKNARSLQVDGEVEFARLLYGHVGGFSALENVPGVEADLTSYFGKVGSIAHQATRCHHRPIRKS